MCGRESILALVTLVHKLVEVMDQGPHKMIFQDLLGKAVSDLGYIPMATTCLTRPSFTPAQTPEWKG